MKSPELTGLHIFTEVICTKHTPVRGPGSDCSLYHAHLPQQGDSLQIDSLDESEL